MRLPYLTALAVLSASTLASGADLTIVSPKDSSRLERLAAHELARYVYLRTGQLPARVQADTPPDDRSSIVLLRNDELLATSALKDEAQGLKSQQFLLRTISNGARKTLWIVGGDDLGVLYGAYRCIERLGVRFYLHGDVIPDDRIAAEVPDLNETDRPLFDVRGIQPFHDFPEGPDWWDKDDYLAYVSQLAKLRMNFLGLHCYPEGGVGPEPLVWIGQSSDTDDKGRVGFSAPSQWASTARPGMWGYAAMPTGQFAAGAGQLFTDDPFGPAVMNGLMPRPATPDQANTLFNRTADMLKAVFTEARTLGVKTCIGTETPLIIPKDVQERLRSQGKDPSDPAVVQAVYEGMFRRIMQSHPLDYYWLWTPEGWTWEGNKPDQFEATARDIRAALAAIDTLGKPFTLATSGWVLGPQNDRAALDKLLPKSSPMSCINRQVGHSPVEPAFAAIKDRPRWAIPWMENDPNLVAPQPWVGRMRCDAADALKYGCTGLLGIHWRTKAMAANVSALAAAGWDQTWVPADYNRDTTPPVTFGPQGGTVVQFTAPVADTEDAPIYQSVRYNMDAYHLKVPNGSYTVTLQFNEPHYKEAGKRVFGVELQGKLVVPSLDMFARAGGNKALDFSFPDVAVTDGLLIVSFVRQTEFPCIAGIVVKGDQATRKINCGGPAYKDYEADLESFVDKSHDRSMPVSDFYTDFARTSYGANVAESVGAILARIDGHHLPEPSGWITGPGNIKPNPEPWSKVKDQYAFVTELVSLRSEVQGAGHLERFDSLLDTYCAMVSMAELGCLRGELDQQVAAIKAEPDGVKKKNLAQLAVRTRLRMARVWEQLILFELGTVETPGELGTIANLEQHTRKQAQFLSGQDSFLAEATGEALPATAEPSQVYSGKTRLIVPTVRTKADCGETMMLKVMTLSRQPVADLAVFVRSLGQGDYQRLTPMHLGQSVYSVALPKADTDFEYYAEAHTQDGQTLHWPATAPAMSQTVIVEE